MASLLILECYCVLEVITVDKTLDSIWFNVYRYSCVARKIHPA